MVVHVGYLYCLKTLLFFFKLTLLLKVFLGRFFGDILDLLTFVGSGVSAVSFSLSFALSCQK